MSTQDVTLSIACTTSSFTVGGTANNLVGSGLVLQINGQPLPVSTSSFTFPAIPSGSTYDIQIATQPSNPTQVCTLADGSGTVGGENITNVRLDCVTTEFAVRGQLSGLAGSGLVLQNNGGDNLALAADGPFTFPDSLPQGAPYSVTVATPPSNPAQECVITNGAGTLGTSDVTNVQVSCTVVEFTVGGSVSGLSGSGQPGSSVLLQNNGGATVEVATDGTFTFPLLVRTGENYNVTVSSQPSNPTRLCSVINGAGVMGSAAVTNVQVFCIPLPIFP